MKARIAAVAILLTCAVGLSQRPSDPALLVPQSGPALDFVPVADPLSLPAGTTIGFSADLEFDANGHLWVLNRGPQPVAEFDENGKFIRAFGEGQFGVRPHGITLDKDGSIWISDGSTHIVVKMDQQGKVLMTLGSKGQRGEWNESAQSRLLNEPNDVAIGPNGDIFVVQGHMPAGGDPRVLKFDKTGKFLKTWGGKGTEPGKFAVAHAIEFDAKGRLWVADRENQRIQIFDTEGNFVSEKKYAGLPCGFDIGGSSVYMVNGFAGQILKMDLDGNVQAVLGKPGTALGEFGEAHYIAVSPKGDLYIADVTKGVQKFVKK